MNLEEVIRQFSLPRPRHVELLTGGANNRVYRLTFESEEPVVLKQYFQHPNDSRPRLQAEFSFLQYAWKCGVRNVPAPLRISEENNAAIYSHICGRSVQIGDITKELIQALVDFFLALNRYKERGRHLPRASEACFSVQEYLQITEKRIGRLEGVAELKDFWQKELCPKWQAIKCKAALHCTEAIDIQAACITPSDFGFHNALLGERKLFFLDFEYAGWDDPCKTVCDLFCQPRVPIPKTYFSSLSQAVASVAADAESCLKRIQVVLPVMQIKWCCILLNAFTQVGSQRRAFSHSDEGIHKENQLKKAKELLANIEESPCLI